MKCFTVVFCFCLVIIFVLFLVFILFGVCHQFWKLLSYYYFKCFFWSFLSFFSSGIYYTYFTLLKLSQSPLILHLIFFSFIFSFYISLCCGSKLWGAGAFSNLLIKSYYFSDLFCRAVIFIYLSPVEQLFPLCHLFHSLATVSQRPAGSDFVSPLS